MIDLATAAFIVFVFIAGYLTGKYLK